MAALAHVSTIKAQALAALAAGVVCPAALHALPAAITLATGLPRPVEGLTAAVVAAALAGIWAQAVPQAQHNEAMFRQVRAC